MPGTSLPVRSRAIRRHLAALAAVLLIGVGVPDTSRAQPPAHVVDELLIGFHGGLSETDEEDVYRPHGGVRMEKLRSLRIHRVRVPASQLDAVERRLRRHPAVKFVERNGILPPDMAPNDPSYGSQWHLPRIAAPQAWDYTVGSAGVIVAVLDTGVDPSHPDLAGKLVPGYNFYANNTDTQDTYGHGTRVAGAAAASGNNGVGVASVAWQSRIMPIRVSDPNGYAYYSTIANGLTWAVDHGASVMNVSFAGVAGSSAIASAAQYVRTHGGVVVVAAGNCGCVDATAENPYLISVSATTSTDALASWSSRGAYVDLAAPGESILTTAMGGGYGSASGTSFASPVTAGVVALMRAMNPELDPADLEALLESSADDLGGLGWDAAFGYGRVNAHRAVLAAAVGAPPPDTTPPVVAVTSPADGATVAGTVTISVAATDDRQVARVEVYLDGALLGSDTATPYGVTWDTRSAGNGPRVVSAMAYDTAGNAGTSTDATVAVANPVDLLPPTVAITSMTTSGPKLTVAVAASDDIGVTRVELFVDGALVASDPSAPYSFSVNTKKYPRGPHTVQATAYDAAGRSGTSALETFTK